MQCAICYVCDTREIRAKVYRKTYILPSLTSYIMSCTFCECEISTDCAACRENEKKFKENRTRVYPCAVVQNDTRGRPVSSLLLSAHCPCNVCALTLTVFIAITPSDSASYTCTMAVNVWVTLFVYATRRLLSRYTLLFVYILRITQ